MAAAAGAGASEPFWGPVDSNINWCENDYEVSPYVAEFYNTVSSLPMIFLGLRGALWVATRAAALPRFRFYVGFACLGVVGVGSTMFHATLRYHYQLLDELPMLYGNAALLYISLEDDRTPKYPGPALPLFLVAFTTAVTVVYLAFPAWYIIFLVSYSAILLLQVAIYVRTLRKEWISERARKLFWLSFASYFSGVFLWMLENAACQHLPGWWKLHAVWHLLAGTGTYLVIEFGLAVRAEAEKHKYGLGWGLAPYPVPFVELVVKRAAE